MPTIEPFTLFRESANLKNEEDLASWQSRWLAGLPVVIPRVVGREVWLYVLAHRAEQLRTYLYVVRAVFGREWLLSETARGLQHSLADEFDRQLAATVPSAKRLQVKTGEARPVHDAWRLLSNLLDYQPPASVEDEALDIRDLLALLRRAVVATDIESARTVLSRISGSGALESHNLRFLEVWTLAELAPNELREKQFDMMLTCIEDPRRPRPILESVGRAILFPVLGHPRAQAGLQVVVDLFKKHILAAERTDQAAVRQRRAVEILRSQGGPIGRSFQLLWVLAEHEQGPSEQLIEAARQDGVLRDSLLDEMTASKVPAPLSVDELIGAGRFADAVAAVEAEGPRLDGARQLARMCVDHPGALSLLNEWIGQLKKEKRDAWLTECPVLARLSSQQDDTTLDRGGAMSWSEWLQSIIVEMNPENLKRLADFRVEPWPLLKDPGSTEELSALTATLQRVEDDLNGETVRRYLPELILAYVDARDDVQRSAALQRSMANLVEFLCFAQGPGQSDLESAALLMHGMLRDAPDAEAYRTLVNAHRELLDENPGNWLLDPVTDFLEVLTEGPCPDREAVRHFVVSVTGRTTASLAVDRAKSHQVSLLLELAELLEFGSEVLAVNQCWDSKRPEKRTKVGECQVDDLHVGVYSLDETSSVRAARYIKERYGAKVTLNHDKVATDALTAMASGCKPIIMVVRSAKHAATDWIRQKATDDVLVIPRGRGSTSIINALEEYILKQEREAA